MRGASFLLGLDALWMGGLLLVFVVLKRELGILESRFRLSARTAPDGLEVGEPVPGADEPHRDRVLLFLLEECGPCRDLVSKLDEVLEPARLQIVVIPRQRGEGTDLAIPSHIQAKSRVEGKLAAERFRVTSGPLALTAERGLISAKSYVGTVDLLNSMIAAIPHDGRHAADSR